MTTTFGPASAHLRALESVVSGIEANERRRRAHDAEQLQLLADALAVAAAENGSGHGSAWRLAAAGLDAPAGEASTAPTSAVPASDAPATAVPASAAPAAAVPASAVPASAVPSGASGDLAYRSVRAELATALHVSEQTIERRMSHAYVLTAHYRDTFAALRDGLICEQHTQVIVDAGQVIGLGDSSKTVERRAAYEAAVLAIAVEETPGRLRPIAKRIAEQCAETPVEQRHEEARLRRCVRLLDLDDGMCDLIAHLPAIEAHAIFDRLTRMSRRLEQQQAEELERGATTCAVAARTSKADTVDTVAAAANTAAATDTAAAATAATDATATALEPVRRTRDEIRADLFADLLTSGDPESTDPASPSGERLMGLAAIQAQVQVTVTDVELFSQMQGTGEVADSPFGSLAPGAISAALSGHGPIAVGDVRELAANAPHWNLVTHDPESGLVLSVDTYRPSVEMRRMLRMRDEHCRFPGCRASAHRCDLDHTVDAALGGATTTLNLAHLCRGHHMLKHHGGWSVTQRARGELEWRSPTGRVHRDRPRSSVRFVPSPEGDARQPQECAW